MVRSSLLERLAAPLAAGLIRHDLPGLPDDRVAATVRFVQRRLSGLPSIIRFGVTVISGGLGAVARGRFAQPVIATIARRPLPLVGEFVRLVRSLSYAYVWETWPETAADGGQR